MFETAQLKGGFARKKYDYIFIGTGASASLLMLALHRRDLFIDAQVLLIDQEKKNKNDKTFCF